MFLFCFETWPLKKIFTQLSTASAARIFFSLFSKNSKNHFNTSYQNEFLQLKSNSHFDPTQSGWVGSGYNHIITRFMTRIRPDLIKAVWVLTRPIPQRSFKCMWPRRRKCHFDHYAFEKMIRQRRWQYFKSLKKFELKKSDSEKTDPKKSVYSLSSELASQALPH